MSFNKMCGNSGIQTHNHLVCKRTLNHLSKLTNKLSCVVSSYLVGTFDCIKQPCQVRVSKWIYKLQLHECEVNPCWKQARYMQQRDSNLQPLSKRTLNLLAKLANWLSCVVSTYLYSAFDGMSLLCYIRLSKWVYTL